MADQLRPVLLRLARRIRREAQSSTLSAVQTSILGGIETQPDVTASELAASEQMSAAAMSRHIGALEQAGFIARGRVSDRRRAPITLTAAGAEALRAVRSERTAWLAGRLALLSPTERWALEAALAPLQSLLEIEPR